MTDSASIKAAAENWAPKWQENGWKNAKGKPIADAKMWQQYFEHLKRLGNVYFTHTEHTYKQWMIEELEREQINDI